jgi:hypothetical protein
MCSVISRMTIVDAVPNLMVEYINKGFFFRILGIVINHMMCTS